MATGIIYQLGSNKTPPTNVSPSGKMKPGQPYILDLVTRQFLYFQNIPKDVKYTPESLWMAVASAGRNNPNYQYVSGDDTLQFTLSYYADTPNRQDVWTTIKWLESLARNDSYDNKPHQVQCVWGDLWQTAIWIVKSAGPVTLDLFDREYGMMPKIATQELTLKRVTEVNRPLSDIQSIYS